METGGGTFALEGLPCLNALPSLAQQTRQGGVIRTGDGALSPAAALERYIERKYLSGGQNTLGDDTSAPAVGLSALPCSNRQLRHAPRPLLCCRPTP